MTIAAGLNRFFSETLNGIIPKNSEERQNLLNKLMSFCILSTAGQAILPDHRNDTIYNTTAWTLFILTVLFLKEQEALKKQENNEIALDTKHLLTENKE